MTARLSPVNEHYSDDGRAFFAGVRANIEQACARSILAVEMKRQRSTDYSGAIADALLRACRKSHGGKGSVFRKS